MADMDIPSLFIIEGDVLREQERLQMFNGGCGRYVLQIIV